MRTILVLGGGGVKGMSHLGAWQALEELDVQVDEIIGTSIGALVAAALGAGRRWSDLAPEALKLRKADIVSLNRWVALLNGIRQPSAFMAAPLRAYIRRILPVERFDELALPVSMNAVDLETGRMEWFGAGGREDVPLVDAIYASCALPLFYPPANIGGRYFVDGGVGDALPITRARERGADVIIAVDAGGGAVRDPLDTIANGLVAIHHRIYQIMSNARQQELLASWSGPPIVLVRPNLDGYSTFDFNSTRYFLEEGYRAAMREVGGWMHATVPAD